MKSKFDNKVHIEGILYDHDLKIKASGPNSKAPGTEFISGTVKVATDADMLNVIEVHYSYVTEKQKNGNTSATFTNLNDILTGKNMTYMAGKGKEDYVPSYVRIDTAIGLNDFYSEQNGQTELVSAKRNEGGFLHFIRENELNPEEGLRNYFDEDFLVTSFSRIDADEEKNLPEKMNLRGVVFDFRRGILPVDFSVYDPAIMDFVETENPAPVSPLCMSVRGQVISQTTTIRQVTESKFGPAIVKELPRNRKEYMIISVGNVYDWNDDSFITEDELRKAMADREVYLATVKKNAEDYKAQKANTTAAPVVTKTGGFNF